MPCTGWALLARCRRVQRSNHSQVATNGPRTSGMAVLGSPGTPQGTVADEMACTILAWRDPALVLTGAPWRLSLSMEGGGPEPYWSPVSPSRLPSWPLLCDFPSPEAGLMALADSLQWVEGRWEAEGAGPRWGGEMALSHCVGCCRTITRGLESELRSRTNVRVTGSS